MKILLIICFTLLSGCASVKRTGPATNVPYESLSEVSQKAEVIGELVYADSVNINIDSKLSPKISRNLRVNNFELIEVSGIQDEKFKFVVTSICDCLGFRKWTVSPMVSLYDYEGNEIEITTPIGTTTKTIQGVFPYTGTYKLIVEADSEFIGKSVSFLKPFTAGTGGGDVTFTGGGILGQIQIPIKVHPEGLVRVSWAKNENIQ